ncbi:MAG: ATP-dependent DNA ligase [Candidatus Micrarchaeota archaeon]
MQFLELAQVFEIMEKTASRLQLTSQLAKVYFNSNAADARHLTYLCQGILVPESQGIQLGIGDKLAQNAISRVSGSSIKQIEELYRKEGDLGASAQILLSKKAQSSLLHEDLTTRKVYDNFLRIATASGEGSQDQKINLLSELLTNASPIEAKHVIRFVQGSLRLGVGESTIIDSLAIYWILRAAAIGTHLNFDGKSIPISGISPEFRSDRDAKKGEASTICFLANGELEGIFPLKKGVEVIIASKLGNVAGDFLAASVKGAKTEITLEILEEKKKYKAIIERAFNMRCDLGEVAENVLEGKIALLEKISPRLFSPIRPALAERLLTPEQIIEKLGDCSVEGKYDGFRLQIHKSGSKVMIFSRKQEPMTHMFPDLVKAIQKEFLAKDAILEGEAIAFDAKQNKFLPFQVTIQRKRKHDISQMALSVPLRLFAFELLFAQGIDYTNVPYENRRKMLESLIAKDAKVIQMASRIIAKKPVELRNFFELSLREGLEGIIAKDLHAPYTAGARKFAWIKMKKSYGKVADTFDVVIIGYYYGKGKRAQFEFGGVLTAIYDPGSQKYKSIAKVGTGFSEEEMGQFKKELEGISLKEKPASVESEITPDVWVKPKIVIEVNADEISRSPTHSAGKGLVGDEGFALRFPRLVSVRKDKGPKDATTESEIFELFELQGQK